MNRLPAPVLLLFVFSCASVLPAAGQQPAAGFGDRQAREIALPEFTNSDLARLVTTLDGVLPSDPGPAGWGEAAKMPLWDFVRRLQEGRLSPSQEAIVLGHLDGIARAHPDVAPVVDETRRSVRRLTIGKEAPDITGADLDGNPMALSDFRGKVVVLKFGGAWCAICRSEYPYERFLTELYANWPFAILGVDGSDTPEAARRSQIEHRLSYRAWWDGRSGSDGRGPIAAEWNVMGWPTTYVLDANGVIRFVDLRSEDLLKAVRQLLVEEQRRLLSAGQETGR